MADNYLEKKMEEHQRGGVAAYTPRRTVSGRKAGFAMLPFDIDKAFVFASEAGGLTQKIVAELRETGCRVALAGVSVKDMQALSMRMGCASISIPDYGKALETISAKWGEPELRIRINAGHVLLELGRGTSQIIKAETTPESEFSRRAAQLCVYLALPDSQGRVFGDFIV